MEVTERDRKGEWVENGKAEEESLGQVNGNYKERKTERRVREGLGQVQITLKLVLGQVTDESYRERKKERERQERGEWLRLGKKKRNV